MKLGASLPAYRTYALEELKDATNNFDASSLIAEDSSGQVQVSNDYVMLNLQLSQKLKLIRRTRFMFLNYIF